MSKIGKKKYISSKRYFSIKIEWRKFNLSQDQKEQNL